MSATHLLVAAAALLLNAPSPLAQSWTDAEQRAWASFDPDGAHDHGHLPKLLEGAPRPAPVIETLDGAGVWSGGPANDACDNAAVIPGSMVNFNPPLLDTSTALTELCEAQESCEKGGSGVSRSVWYSYTPDRDGLLTVDTFGSSYDTVLSVFNGCGVFGFPCTFQPDELACNDDYFFGTASQLSLDVQAGTTYRIKVAEVGFPGSGGGSLDLNARFAPAHQLCSTAQLISGTVYQGPLVSTHNATTEACEAQESCEFNGVGTSNSVYYRYLPPCDGYLSVNTNGSTYDTVLSLHDGCAAFQGIDIPCALPVELACDDDGGTGTASQLIDVPVLADQELLIKVADYNPSQGGGYLELNLVFSGSEPPLAQIDLPTSISCVCELVTVTGTASASDALLAGWELATRPVAGSSWTTLASGSEPVQADLLANWSTLGLAEGYHLLRLSVTNACGAATADTAVVYVEQGGGAALLDEPADGARVGGTVCVSGTVAEHCLTQWRLELLPENGPAITLHTGSSNISAGSLMSGGWDTTAYPDGKYTLRLAASDSCGNLVSDEHIVVLDNTAPTATITAPRDCVVTDGTVTIRGSVHDQNLSGWQLQLAGGDVQGWSVLASGAGSLVDQPLATLDLGSLPKCGYTLRLLATDGTLIDCAFHAQAEDLLSLTNTLNVLPTELP